MRSPLTWMGGKTYLAEWIKRLMPTHFTYVEVFAGGGSLLFSKQRSKVEILNDTNDSLVLFYDIVKNDIKRKKLIKELDKFIFSRQVFNTVRKSYLDGSMFKLGDVERTARWFFLTRSCFNGEIGAGFKVSVQRNAAEWYRNVVNNLDTFAKRLEKVYIEKLDFRECIKRFDREETFFYVDPPYHGVQQYYDDGKGRGCVFKEKDHRDLALLLNRIKGKAMVSHYRSEWYDKLYNRWYRYEKEVFKMGSQVGRKGEKTKAVEVLYCNYEPKVVNYQMSPLF